MTHHRLLTITTLATLLAFGLPANATPVSKCNAAKKKCIGKYIAAALGCHAKAEAKGIAVSGACLGKAAAKITGGGKGCFDTNDAKAPNDCSVTGDAAAELMEADQLVLDVVAEIDPAYPAPALTKCGAAKKKCVGNDAAGQMSCAAKANRDGVGDPPCGSGVTDKFDGAKGCFTNAITKGTDCVGTATAGDLETLLARWSNGVVVRVDNVPTVCGDGVASPSEPCDGSVPPALWSQCGPDFTCTNCNCACPTRMEFAPNSTDPATVIDSGWSGLAHGMSVLSNGTLSLALSCGASGRPCGTCTVSGPIPNLHADAGQLNNHRCTGNTHVKCVTDPDCAVAGGTCEFFLGAPQPQAVGGVSVCSTYQINGDISGTANVETGELAITAPQLWRIYVTGTLDSPCPGCSGDATPNDGIVGGTCTDGPSIGAACDANGSSAGFVGSTSLDCPPGPERLIGPMPLAFSPTTGTASATLSASNPDCTQTGYRDKKCLCSTCNNRNQETCQTNADCPSPAAGPIGPICGGQWCIGGADDGLPCRACSGGANDQGFCSTASACPGGTCILPTCASGGLCGRLGESTQPNSCLDDTSVPGGGFLCADTAPVGDGEGSCPDGPFQKLCANHPWRNCSSDGDCNPGSFAGACADTPRRCFLDNGIVGNSIIGVGMADPPVGDRATPTMSSVFCVPPARATSVNAAYGFPGPGRMTLRGLSVAHP